MHKKVLAGLIALGFAAGVQAQQKYEVKVATVVGPQHFMSKWLVQWSEKLEKASGGRLVFKHFPGSQMGPTPAMYDLARTGQAEVAWFLHGATPGRFQLTELIQLLDGVFIDYGGAGVAFKMGGTVKYSTEMYSFVSSFGIGMNPDFYKSLPADLRKLVDDSTQGVEKEVGEGWDALDDIGKKLLLDGGSQPIKLSAAENARFRKVGAEVTEAKLKELEGKGLKAREAFKLIQSLSEKHAKTSRSFWN